MDRQSSSSICTFKASGLFFLILFLLFFLLFLISLVLWNRVVGVSTTMRGSDKNHKPQLATMPPRTLLLLRPQCVRTVPLRPLRPVQPPSVLLHVYTSSGPNPDVLPPGTEGAVRAAGETPPHISEVSPPPPSRTGLACPRLPPLTRRGRRSNETHRPSKRRHPVC